MRHAVEVIIIHAEGTRNVIQQVISGILFFWSTNTEKRQESLWTLYKEHNKPLTPSPGDIVAQVNTTAADPRPWSALQLRKHQILIVPP